MTDFVIVRPAPHAKPKLKLDWKSGARERMREQSEIFVCRLCRSERERWQMSTPKSLNVCAICTISAPRNEFSRAFYRGFGWADASVIGLAGDVIKLLEKERGRQKRRN